MTQNIRSIAPVCSPGKRALFHLKQRKPRHAFRPKEPGTISVPGSIFLWCPRADSKTSPAGKLVTRPSTVRIRRRLPQTRNGAALATPSYSLVPPGGFENSPPAGKLVTRVSPVRIRPLDQKSPAPWWYRARQISGAPGRIRTVDTRFRRAVLYPLSYGGMLY